MDAVSYSLASKQAQRIEKFIENPDSTSGIVTVPKVIASGETITIPAGRVAILPNVQIDGVLNVENGGEVFIPSGASLSKVVEKVTSTDNAIVRFDGTTGAVQNSGVIIDDNNNVGIGLTPSAWGSAWKSLDLLSASISSYTTLTDQYTIISNNAYISGSSSTTSSVYKNNGSANSYNQGGGIHLWRIAPSGTAGNAITWTNAMILGDSGNLLLTSGTGGLGYGTGSGGTVTQLTNKNFNVSLNKPTGTITTSNSVLVAGQGTSFAFLNSLLTINDNLTITSKGIINYDIYVIDIYNGAAVIRIFNRDSISHSDAISINFSIIKGANS